MKDYYRILEIPGNATQTEIRKAYYKKAHQFHPDKTTDPQHHQIFLDINEAYEILGDKQKREVYHYRWVNYHNPPKAKAYAATQTTAPPQSQQKAQPYYTRHYQNYTRPTYQEYEPFLRRVCQIVLLISGLIILDYLFAIPYPNETILDYTITHTKREHSFWVYTEHTKFKAPSRAYGDISLIPGQKINVWQTPLFKQITRISFENQKWAVNPGSIYHNFFVVVLLQTLLAIAGLYKKFFWHNRLNFGTIAGLCALITILIMAIT